MKYSWSPDGKYLAFWLESVQNQVIKATLAVLDMASGDVTDYCLSAGNVRTMMLLSYPLIWSPDGKSLVTIVNRDEGEDFDTVLVDLDGGFAVKIAENLTPGGWHGCQPEVNLSDMKNSTLRMRAIKSVRVSMKWTSIPSLESMTFLSKVFAAVQLFTAQPFRKCRISDIVGKPPGGAFTCED